MVETNVFISMLSSLVWIWGHWRVKGSPSAPSWLPVYKSLGERWPPAARLEEWIEYKHLGKNAKELLTVQRAAVAANGLVNLPEEIRETASVNPQILEQLLPSPVPPQDSWVQRSLFSRWSRGLYQHVGLGIHFPSSINPDETKLVQKWRHHWEWRQSPLTIAWHSAK